MSSRVHRHLITWFCLLVPWLAHAEDSIRVVTEELPPYSMTIDGKPSGLATEVVQALLDEVGEQSSIQSMPWARAYDTALNGHNVLIYSIARTPEREALFNWIGPIAPGHWFLYSTQANLHLDSLEQARQYQIATVKDDVGERYLLSRGFEIGTNLQSSNRYELNYEKLRMGRVDLWIINKINADYILRQQGQPPEHPLYPVLDLGNLDGAELSLAFSRNTSAATLARFRQGLQALKENGQLEAIYARWQ